MLLVSAKVGPFKSIERSQTVTLDPRVTVLVGMNEAGKTAFLQALHKGHSVENADRYIAVEDYPRKDLTAYLREEEEGRAADVAVLTYRLNDSEVVAINKSLKTTLPAGFQFSVTHKYDNTRSIYLHVDEQSVIQDLLSKSGLGTKAKTTVSKALTLQELQKKLEGTAGSELIREEIARRVAAAEKSKWTSTVSFEVWQALSPLVPKFLYFDDYYILPGKVNLADLHRRATQATELLEPQHRAILALLRMADVQVDDLINPAGYETIKAKLEGISNSITDQVFNFWKQNEDLEVEFDIRSDPGEQPPYDNGNNLYIRIRNRRHRVTVPFDKRSRGFIWFFSFLVWFDSVKQQLSRKQAEGIGQLILLLDEPGLSLHALAQADFLRYIDDLSTKHQVVYTTHSPFMVHSDRMHQIRIVEDRRGEGSVITDNITGSDPRTLFPLQAALGYTIAQNLFISPRNLLVEGPADLIYIQFMSSELERLGRTSLREDVTIVPVGGLDKVATFVALLRANALEMVVVHDTTGAPDQRIMALVRDKVIAQRAILTYGEFRGSMAKPVGKSAQPQQPKASDVEDLFSVTFYLSLFNGSFQPGLGSQNIVEKDLLAGDRIVERINRYLSQEQISLRPSGGFNHYAVAAHLARNPPKRVDKETLDNFESLFKAVNQLFSA